MDVSSESTLLWSPGKRRSSCGLSRFIKFVNERYGCNFDDDYNLLHKWSVTELSLFWESFMDFSEMKYSIRHTKVINEDAAMNSIPSWFDGCRMNYAENLLKYPGGNKVALYGKKEGDVGVETRTWSQLQSNVRRISAALREMNIAPGDRVVGYMPNCIEAIEAMLAASALGAVWSSASPDFGPSGVLDRFSQIGPVVLFSVNAVIYNGKIHDNLDKVKKVASGLPSLKRVVLLPFVKERPCQIVELKNSCTWSEFMDGFDNSPMEFTQLPFNHPLFIMYSSGTTGAPKCIVHSAGGTLITHMKEHLLHCDMGPDDLLIYYATTGWMMWNWAASALVCGSSILCYDGSPLKPHDALMWDLVDELGITVLGTSAKWLAVMEDRGVSPISSHKLRSLRMILSTGSPLRPSSFDYVYNSVKKDIHLASITGGTDIIGCFMGGNPLQPVYKGELQSPLLGMAMEVWNKEGKQVFDQSGELICTRSFPSMPIEFWNDPEGKKYQSAYFNRFPGVWCHGDFCLLNSKTKGFIMLGRSDGTLNPSGVRFGSAEIYDIVEKFPEVADSLCVGQNDYSSGERVILFIKLNDPIAVSNGESVSLKSDSKSSHVCPPSLEQDIRNAIRIHLSVRHVPEKILAIPEIPYTINGKKVEVAVRHILNGHPECANSSSLSNPQSLKYYSDVLPFI